MSDEDQGLDLSLGCPLVGFQIPAQTQFEHQYGLAPPPPPPFSKFTSLSQSSYVPLIGLTDGIGRGKGGGRIQIIRRRESLVIYSPLTTLWYQGNIAAIND
jgi:hypothetical protein